MAQVNIYIPDELKKKIEKLAKSRKSSLSQLVAEAITKHLADSWPDKFFDLFGSVEGQFERPTQEGDQRDVPREEL